MNSIQLSNALLRTIFILISIALGLYFIYLISSIVIYIICAFLLSFIAEPFVRFLKQAKIKCYCCCFCFSNSIDLFNYRNFDVVCSFTHKTKSKISLARSKCFTKELLPLYYSSRKLVGFASYKL